jgi:ABC-2 type transport system permease protein
MNRLRAYSAILRGSVILGLIYRLGFIFTIFGNIIYICVAYFLWRSIYSHSKTMHGLTFNEAFIYVALGSTVFILLKTYADWAITREINEGKIAVYLTKPLDYQLYWLCMSLGYTLTSLVAITVPTILLLTLVFKVNITFGLGLVFFPLSLLLAFIISFNLDYIVGLLAFYTESTWGLSMTKEIIVTVLSGALLPLQFFPASIQKILLWLPFQAIYYSPLAMISQPSQSWDVFLPILAVQFLWVFISFIVTRLFYRQAIKILRVSGG